MLIFEYDHIRRIRPNLLLWLHLTAPESAFNVFSASPFPAVKSGKRQHRLCPPIRADPTVTNSVHLNFISALIFC